MKKVAIRQANLSDLQMIQKLNHELFKLEKKSFDSTLVVDWPLSSDGEKYFKDLIENDYVIVATDNDNVIGYLAGSINERGVYSLVQYGEINNMFVANEYRGCGIGTALVKKFKEYCVAQGIKDLKVVASAKNKSAQDFYKKQGFGEFDITLTASIK